MKNEETSISRLDELFYPESIAIVGLPRKMKSGSIFLMGLKDQGFRGKIYPVHPVAEQIEGIKAYPSVSAIPGPVDLAIVMVPHHSALPVIQECGRKGVKGAVLFTAGYKETGTEKGRAMEAELVDAAGSSGMRIIGPNCMGLYCPESGLSFFPGLSTDPGQVGIISHSGSLANILGRVAAKRGIRFSKVASLGNEADLNSTDFLAYLGQDSKTRVVGAYMENVKNGPGFLRTLQKVCREKPVILWKAGLTPEGSRAAASHTGALAGSQEIWEGVVRQAGAVTVVGFEAWVDAMAGFSLLPERWGDRVAIVSGPGGLAVGAADACGREGLRLADLSPGTCSALSEILPPTGTSLRNPIDVGFTGALDMAVYDRVTRKAAEDPGVDALLIIGHGLTPESSRQYLESMIDAHRGSGKPFLMVDIPGLETDLSEDFGRAGMPFFDTAERALATYALFRRYHLGRSEMP
jgi:acyl-CoA synthetase (NDP forming)